MVYLVDKKIVHATKMLYHNHNRY